MRNVTWPHTGIEAPLHLRVQKLQQIVINAGVAFSCELIHPDHGVVGEVFNEGRGGDTRFNPFNPSVFGYRQLAELAAQTREEAAHGDDGVVVETLLNAAVDESEYQWDVDRMRRDNTFLVRRFCSTEDSPYGVAWRGEAVEFTRAFWSHAERAAFIASTTQRGELEPHRGEVWQMYTGQAWVRLLSESRYTPDEQAERTAVLEQHAPSDDGTLLDGLHVRPVLRLDDHRMSRGDAFQLVADNGVIRTSEWCRCRVQRPHRVRFERWSVKNGLVGAGEVHAKKTCRRIVSIE